MTEKLKENPGVKPGSSEVIAELKSITRKASRKEPQHPDVGGVQANIPPKLRRLLSPADLRRNAEGYEEMELDLPRALVDMIKERLLKLPLVHRTDVRRFTDSPGPETTLYDEPVPHSFLLSEGDNPEEVGNTYKLDQDLDLDEFVFLSWGEVYAGFVEGRYALLISPEVLFLPDCLVTPYDIADTVSKRELRRGKNKFKIGTASKVQDEYLAKMVTGKDWLEIQARRIAKMYLEGTPIRDALRLTGLGEIKLRGPIPKSMIIASLDLSDSSQYVQYRDEIRSSTGFELEKPHGRLRKIIGKIF